MPPSKILTSQFRRILVLLALAQFCSCLIRAQIIDFKKVGNKTVYCGRSGLFSSLKVCDADPDYYTYVFIGTVANITPRMDDQEQLEIDPQEVFLGNPDDPITVITAQLLCGPRISVGDQWLFYLRKEKGKPLTLDVYAGASRPVADVQSQIETLRRLETVGDYAILRGKVWQGAWPGPFLGNNVGIPHANVIARRKSDGAQYITISDSKGRYEFQPLPPGTYKITVIPIGSYKPDDSSIDLHPGQCRDMTLDKSSPASRASVSGQVQHFDGSPAANISVVIISATGDSYDTTQTDKDGHFTFERLDAGDYVVGVDFPHRADWFNGGGAGAGLKLPPASLFYPGVGTRSEAGAIHVSADEKVKDIDFLVPAS